MSEVECKSHQPCEKVMKVALSCANNAENRSSQTRSPEFIAAGRDLWQSTHATSCLVTIKRLSDRNEVLNSLTGTLVIRESLLLRQRSGCILSRQWYNFFTMTTNPTPIDISNFPDLKRLAHEAKKTGKPYVLRENSHDI